MTSFYIYGKLHHYSLHSDDYTDYYNNNKHMEGPNKTINHRIDFAATGNEIQNDTIGTDFIAVITQQSITFINNEPIKLHSVLSGTIHT